jgi:hypothetical protein
MGHVHDPLQRLVEIARAVELPGVPALAGHLPQSQVPAMANLGAMLASGELVRKDYAAAFRWFEEAALAGAGEAMFNLASMYENGMGVRKDREKANEWYRKAAKAGIDEATGRIR